MDLFPQACGCQAYSGTELSQVYTTGQRAVSERAGGLLAFFLHPVSLLLSSSTHSHSLIFFQSLTLNPADIFIHLPILQLMKSPHMNPVISSFCYTASKPFFWSCCFCFLFRKVHYVLTACQALGGPNTSHILSTKQSCEHACRVTFGGNISRNSIHPQ